MLLDSNILIYAADGAVPELDAIISHQGISIASVTRIETLGYHKLKPHQKTWLECILGRIQTFALSEPVIIRAIELRQERKMSLGDSIIAATALMHGRKLVTRNVADFEHIAGLEIINPFPDNPA
ncbi:MAG: type II toxin-antitoxin system VapC family toxin [Roseimicrobium sp.]